MKLEIPDDYLPLIVTSLEHYYAYSRATQRDDSRYQEAASWFRSKLPTAPEKPPRRSKK